jgi:hypothetical protein
MLHNETLIKKIINQTKRRTLLQALQDNDWKNAIFDDPAILEIALATFINGSITTYQMETILGFHEASIALTHEKRTLTTSPILQSNGEPSPAAKIFLFSNLDGIMYREFTLEKRKSFTLLLQAMIEKNPSENLFYYYRINPKDGLATMLSILNSTIRHAYNTEVHLSTSAYEALRLAHFGAADCMSSRVVLGALSPQDIEYGVMRNYRPKAAFFPRVPSNTDIHGYAAVEDITKSNHDDYHANIGCRTGKTIRLVINEWVSLIKKELLNPAGKTMSSLTWELIDGEFIYFNNSTSRHNGTAGEIAEALSVALEQQRTKMEDEKPNLFTRTGNITDAGIICIIDMAQRLDYWHNTIGFHPELMTGSLADHFKFAMQLKDAFTQDSIHNILLYRTCHTFKEAKFFPVWHEIITQRYPRWKESERFSVLRNNKIHFLGVVDNLIEKTPLASVLPLTLLSTGDITSQKLPQNLINQLDKQGIALLSAYAQIQCTASHYPHIRKTVLTPLHHELLNIVTNEPASKTTLASIKESLTRFIAHHESLNLQKIRPDNALLSVGCDALKQALTSMQEYEKGFTMGFASGFLTGIK